MLRLFATKFVPLLLLSLATGIPSPARGQLAPVQPSAVSSDAEREAEYEQLARDVQALERELGIVKRVVRLVTPSVVHVEAKPVRELRARSDVQEAGSGVIVRLGGKPYVLTNRHVIKNSSAPYVTVQLADGNITHPKQIWSDAKTDVAVMRISDLGLPAARLGNSDTIEIGEQVLAVGSPFGLSQSVTRGIVSAKGRYNLDLGDGEVELQNFLQTDAAINPGNSGGPLINLRGEVVGMNTAIASNSGGNEGIGFSIPINIVMRIAGDLARSGKVTRGFLGVKLDSMFDTRRARSFGLPRLTGTRVKSIEPGSPAEAARLKSDDIILLYDNVRVEDDDHLISLVQLTEIGRRVPVVVFRDRKERNLSIRIGDDRAVVRN